MRYRPEIDGLRALAVMPVLFFHAGFEFFRGGYVGVDVFFVISGYLITSIIVAELRTGSFSIASFYERRARRLLPALFLVVLACIPAAWLWLTPRDMKDFTQSLLGVATFSSNILFWLESGYFDAAAELKPLLHTWSLAVEEQYYVLFPIFLIAVWRFGERAIVVILVVAILASLGAALWLVSSQPTAAFFLLPTRGWEILLGAVTALLLTERVVAKSPVSSVLSAVGLLLIIISAMFFDVTTPTPSLYTLIPTVGAVLIIVFAAEGTLTNKLLGHKVLVGVGLISYSAYLWHQPLFAFIRLNPEISEDSVIMTLAIFVTLGLAIFTWKYVEGPFRKKRFVRIGDLLLRLHWCRQFL